MKHLKSFNNISEYNTFVESEEYILPNVSRIVSEDSVEYNPILPTYVTFSFDQVTGWGNITTTAEFTVPSGTTFAEWMEMSDETNGEYKYCVISGYGSGEINDSGEMESIYEEAVGGGGMNTLYAYLLNADGSKVKGSDVIEERYYEYTVE